jgi:hypothetical protein
LGKLSPLIIFPFTGRELSSSGSGKILETYVNALWVDFQKRGGKVSVGHSKRYLPQFIAGESFTNAPVGN